MEGRLFEGSIGLKGGSIIYFAQNEDCGGLLGEESHIG